MLLFAWHDKVCVQVERAIDEAKRTQAAVPVAIELCKYKCQRGHASYIEALHQLRAAQTRLEHAQKMLQEPLNVNGEPVTSMSLSEAYSRAQSEMVQAREQRLVSGELSSCACSPYVVTDCCAASSDYSPSVERCWEGTEQTRQRVHQHG